MMSDEDYMRRALFLAGHGAGFVSPNPMVGAVIVAPDGRIIGEGWHRRFGGPHAEVNAVYAVPPSDQHLLPLSTIYVTLEPCSHYGKTPPCSELLIRKRLRKVVIGSPDPFPLVAGRGVAMLRAAGIEVVEGCLRRECDELNRRFITAHTLQRPYILLKWAQSRNGMMASVDNADNPHPVALSSPLTQMAMHRERALCDAILVGVTTMLTDRPSLNVRHWPGHNPRPVTFSSPRLPEEIAARPDLILLDPRHGLEEEIHRLYKEYSITSLMVEGGAAVLNSFIKAGLMDHIRVEIVPLEISPGLPAPQIPAGTTLLSDTTIDHSHILDFAVRHGEGNLFP